MFLSYAGEFSVLPSARQQLPSARRNPQEKKNVLDGWAPLIPCLFFAEDGTKTEHKSSAF